MSLNFTFKKFLLFIIFSFLAINGFSQTTGDYRSVATGNWVSLSSWQFYNGTSWVTPSLTQGWPGQYSGTGEVLIQAGNEVTMGTADLTTSNMGSLTINGTLTLDGGGSGATFGINTPILNITPGLSPYANINFANKVTLNLPENVSIQVGTGGLPTPGSGTCTANIQISIGSTPYAYCTGGGEAPNFSNIIADGGYNIIDTITATAVCGSGTSTISASVKPTPTAPTTYNLYSSSTGGTALSSVTSSGSPYSTSSLISPSISSTTTYYVEAVTGSRTTSRKAVTIEVNNSFAPTLSPITQPTCSVATGSFTITNYNSTYSYTITPSTDVIRTGANVTAPTGTYSIIAADTYCTSAETNFTINSQPTTPTAPTAGIPTNPNCTMPTGSVPLSGLPASGTINQTGYRNATYTITGGGSQTISGLLPGTYYFAVSNGSCNSSTVTVVINSPVNNTWSTSGWSNGTPNINQRLIFTADYTNANDVDIEGCSCHITGTSAVTIKSGRTFKIENEIDVTSGSSLTFENNASLVQINDAAENSGAINYHRNTAPVKRYDFTYWSSPVSGQTLKNLSPTTLYDKYYSYNNGWKIIYNGAATMEFGRGYLIRAPQTFSITTASVDTNPVFIGVPNNGVYPLTLAANQVHLLGNPYPSAIDADVFLDVNSSVLEGTLYFWTHNSPPSSAVAGDATYNYTTSDYATFNRTGGVNTTDVAISGGIVPTGKIAAGQGFFAPASSAGGTLIFNNSMRVEGGTSGVNNSQFFKLNTTAKSSTIAVEKNRIWLNLSNKQGAFKQTLVGYLTGATNNYDAGYDGITYDGNQFVDFYSINNKVNFSIQGRALPFVKTDSIALGYKSTIVGDFLISIDHADGALASQNVFLEDKELKVLHDLRREPYTFSTQKGVFNNRFVLRYVDNNTIEETSSARLNREVFVVVDNGVININTVDSALKTIIVFDTAGRRLYQKDNIDSNQFTIEKLDYGHQVLIVDILLADGTKLSSKIVY